MKIVKPDARLIWITPNSEKVIENTRKYNIESV